ncbi:ciliogenesis-associated TTC17-interacting protein isoform X1 [Stigmatopora nigra]
METIEKDDSPALSLAGTQGGKYGSEIRASEEAIMFINGIDPVELPKCVFEDSLVTMSEGGRDLGRFYVSVEFARRACTPCMLLHAQSQGIIDDCPCGTTVTAYLTADLEVLEEEHHEYVKLSDHILDTRCHMVQHEGEMKINKVTTVGKKVTTDSVSYSMSALRGLVTEGSNFLLMRIIALRKKIPEHMSLISFDQKLQLTRTIFRGLEDKQIEIEGETMEVFGMERIVHCVDEDPTTWQCYFLPDGLSLRKVPSLWKTSYVVPVPKTANPREPNHSQTRSTSPPSFSPSSSSPASDRSLHYCQSGDKTAKEDRGKEGYQSRHSQLQTTERVFGSAWQNDSAYFQPQPQYAESPHLVENFLCGPSSKDCKPQGPKPLQASSINLSPDQDIGENHPQSFQPPDECRAGPSAVCLPSRHWGGRFYHLPDAQGSFTRGEHGKHGENDVFLTSPVRSTPFSRSY